jgi:hypothetical protein
VVASTAAPTATASAEKPVATTGPYKAPIVGKAPVTKPSASTAPASPDATVKGRIIRKDL